MDKDLFLKLNSLSTEELCEIYYNLNGFEWDERIGEKPEGFDDLPTRRFKWYHRFTRKITKVTHPEAFRGNPALVLRPALYENYYSHSLFRHPTFLLTF